VLVEAIDEQAALVIGRRAHRTTHRREAAGAKPAGTSIEKSSGYVEIVDRLKEAEEADPVVVELVVRAILDGGDSADWPTVAHGDEELAGSAAIERVPRFVQRVADSNAKGRDPPRLNPTVIDLPRNGDKPTHVANRHNVEGHLAAAASRVGPTTA
jgi:hypothetical protein